VFRKGGEFLQEEEKILVRVLFVLYTVYGPSSCLDTVLDFVSSYIEFFTLKSLLKNISVP